MINLLPPAAKKDLFAGRTNTIIVRYFWIVFILFALLAAISGLTYFVLSTEHASQLRERDASSLQIAQNKSLQERQQKFTKNLSIAKVILDKQTHYSKVLLNIAKIMPAGTVLNNITLDQSAYGSPIEIQLSAKTEADALNLKTAFQESSLFSNVQFKSITIDSTAGAIYPVSFQIQAVINRAEAEK